MTKEIIAKAGSLLCADEGEDSDYLVHGFFVVLRDFDPKAELNAYLGLHPEQAADYRFNGRQFLAALLAKGLLLEVGHGTLYLTGYSSYEEFSFTPAPTTACAGGEK